MIGFIGLGLIGVLLVFLVRTPKKETTKSTARIANRITARIPDASTSRTRPLSPKEAAQLDAASDAYLALYREGLVGTCTDEVPELTDTRIGGPKVWPTGLALPETPQGRRLIQLAHINLADLPQITGLPKAGTLQVLVTDDDIWGCKFPSANGDGFLCVLHDADCTFDLVDEPQENEGYTPIYRSEIAKQGRKISWQKREIPPTCWDYRLKDPYNARVDWPDNVAKVYEDFLNEQADVRGRYDIILLGHPDFTQEDMRRDRQYRGLENLIGFSSSGGAFMWGDVGEACILLPPEAFKSFDLSKALYYYDCS